MYIISITQITHLLYITKKKGPVVPSLVILWQSAVPCNGSRSPFPLPPVPHPRGLQEAALPRQVAPCKSGSPCGICRCKVSQLHTFLYPFFEFYNLVYFYQEVFLIVLIVVRINDKIRFQNNKGMLTISQLPLYAFGSTIFPAMMVDSPCRSSFLHMPSSSKDTDPVFCLNKHPYHWIISAHIYIP